MNMADTFWGFIRRWYIVVPGIILALVAGVGAFVTIPPGYERTATQLLLPGDGTIPADTTNPFLFLGGLLQASDIVVRVMQADDVIGPIVEDYPGTEVEVRRDPTVSGPVIQIVVTGKSDQATEEVLSAIVEETGTVLDHLQTEQNVALADQMRISVLTMDTSSTLQQKTRLVISAGAVLGIFVVTLLLASLIDGLARRPHRGGRRGGRRRGRAAATEVGRQEHADDDLTDESTDGDVSEIVSPAVAPENVDDADEGANGTKEEADAADAAEAEETKQAEETKRAEEAEETKQAEEAEDTEQAEEAEEADDDARPTTSGRRPSASRTR